MSRAKNEPRLRKASNETDENAPTIQSAAETQRRVYALPNEMVERIVEFQKEKGYSSEVEAVRRLLDEALKSRDNLERIISRFTGRLKLLRIVSEVAKDVLVGHPLVRTLKFRTDNVEFELTNGWVCSITDSGEVTIWDSGRQRWEWILEDSKDPFGGGEIRADIPF